MPSAGTRPPGNLPAELASFVGRRAQMAEARNLLASTRLLTMTGPGGVGKSRLARRVAAEFHRAFRQGVWLVELDEINDGELLPLVIGTALGLHDSSTDPGAHLAAHLQDKQLLLVLDNCEHLAKPAAALLKNLLTKAPDLRVLATSRHVLGIEGEFVFSVPPLSLPTAERPGEDSDVELSEAVELFVQRGAAAVPGFSLTAENRDTIVQMCQRVDGVPLAIELAAARLRVYSLEQILDRLRQTMHLLGAGPLSAPVHHQTLHDTLDWSFDLCSPAEQLLWARLSVFAGGFGLRAVEEVCMGDPISSEDVFDLLGSLVDKSIVTNQRDTLSPESRFRLLDTVREYGQERLLKFGEARELQLRHLEYFKALATRAETDYFSPREADWFQEVGVERANIRSALQLCTTEPELATSAMVIASSLRTYWIAPGFILEGYQWLRKALALGQQRTEARARALWAFSYIQVLLGEVDDGFATMGECRVLADELGLPQLRNKLTLCDSLAEFLRGDLRLALDIAEQGVAAGRADGNPAVTGEALFLATIMAFALNDSRTEEYADEAIALHDDHGAQLWKAFVLWIMGLYRCREDDQQRAVASLLEAIGIFQLLKHNLGLACCLDGLAYVAMEAEQPEQAAQLMGAAQGLWRAGPARLPYLYVRQTVVDDAEQRAKSALGTAEFEANFNEGFSLPLEKAVDFAGRRTASRGKLAKAGVTARRVDSPDATSAKLTRRETEIAELVAEGMRNKEIAASLVISTRTVEAHVEHILTKLGFHSRAQIATWLARQSGARDAADG